jgi:Ca2+:H+ antiporter
MVESDEPPLSSRLHSWAKNYTPKSFKSSRAGQEDPDSESTTNQPNSQDAGNNTIPAAGSASPDLRHSHSETVQQNPSAVVEKGEGTPSTTVGTTEPKAPLVNRFIRDVKYIVFSSWINWLLVFVPVGIILGALVDWADIEVVSPSVVFAINAVAIIPLASLLAYATESVASKMGDTVGALLNVTFGNAVELIVFIIALVEGEIRVVQAAALGSILSNLLLILGMCFVAGGLRFREQVSLHIIRV